MDILSVRGKAIGVAALCFLLNTSCFESGEPTEPPHPEVPAQPAISAVDISTTGAYILRWSKAAGATSFVLEEDISTEFAAAYTAYSGPDTTIRFVGKSEGYLYYYRVRGYNENGSGPWSNLHSVRIIRGLFPQIVIQSDTLDFGRVLVGQTQHKQLEISNAGSAALTITSAATGNPHYNIETVLPIIIRPGSGGVLDLRFVPGTAGPSDGTLTVFSNDEDDYPPVIYLTGAGV